ncbi:mechanosensitive ion channel family protein [bacterium]|nr:mechanosensitive ion channel family protein [bacterium]
MATKEYVHTAVQWLLTSGLRIAVILVLMVIASKIARIISFRVFASLVKNKDDEFRKRADTLRSIIRYMLTIGIAVIAAVTIMDELNIKIGPILAAAGVVGLAVGFGAQTLVQDVIGGFFILLEDEIRVGDVVQIAGKSGLVERINLRMTVLRDLSGNVHYIRNGQIDVVTNMTKEYSHYVFDIGVSYHEDVDKVMDVIKQVDEELRNDPLFRDDILEPIEILGLDQFAESALIIKARTKTKPIKQWGVARAFNRLLKKKFDERGIEIPFPQITLTMGADKEGQASPIDPGMKKNM